MARRWLFKSEPSEYGIDQLAAEPDGRARWDGIRNHQARNYLRDEVAAGDLVFFYHSSCRVPGVAGICRVVSSPYPDPSQFDPDSPFFDPRARPDSPRWYAVDIALEERFPEILPAALLRADPQLAEMVLFRQPRLSVQPVSEAQWRRILDLERAQRHSPGR
ncbi:MAG: DUF55 domain-containing protein [Porticoccaceae bacterium]|nr:MAG: DUF55 domain-containing protein [Porticoccaceae bacterium]